VLVSKFRDELSVQLSQSADTPFLVLRLLRPTDLLFVPSFHLVAVPDVNAETRFRVKLLTFHGKLLVRLFQSPTPLIFVREE
jgi:hypothetical protein